MILDNRRLVILGVLLALVAGTSIASRRNSRLAATSQILGERLLEKAERAKREKASFHPDALLSSPQDLAVAETAKSARRQFTIYRNQLGEVVCREATPDEIENRERNLDKLGLRPINHLEFDKSVSAQAPEASNLIIVLRGTQQLQQNAAAAAAFNRAAQNWENVIMSPITIYIDVDFGPTAFGDPWPDQVLGATAAPSNSYPYQSVRSNLVAQANGEGSATKQGIFNLLPATTVPSDLGDASGVDVYDSIARAIGLLPATAQPSDNAAQIAFNSNFTFDFDPSNGITGNATDFDAVATHEIGHALGFDSDAGTNLPKPAIWDLYRFRTGTTTSTFPTAPRILTVGGSPDALQYDFIPGNPELGLSTGGPDGSDGGGGDGWQSSHWKHVPACGGAIGIMDPAIPDGCRRTITANDMLALSSFGFNLTNNNPPPPAPPSPTPPSNDNFANAQTITGCSGSVGGSSYGATSESGEPNHDPPDATALSPGHTIWYQWQAPFSTATTITTLGSDFDTIVAIYTGNSVGSLTRIAFNDDQVNGVVRTSKLTFNPVAGTTYKIAVDGWARDAGTVKLNWDGCAATPSPSPTPTPTPTPSPSPTPTPTPDPPCTSSFTVNDNGDGGDANLNDGLCLTAGGTCTLRAAVQQSNAMTKCSTVNINMQSLSGAINLGSALGIITHGISVNGPGADRLTVQRSSAPGTPAFNVFLVNFGVGVSISGITISNGLGTTNNGGGAIHNFGLLTLANSTVSGNQATNSSGGGVSNDSGGSLTGGTMVIVNSTISGNQTLADGSGPAGPGGGIFNSGVSLTLINSTVSGNKSGISPFNPDGGGVYNFKGAVKFINCTVASNQTGNTGRGGGIATTPSFPATTTLQNTLIADNLDGSNGAAPDLFGPTVSRDYNLIGNAAGVTFTGPVTNNIQNVSAGLGALGNNGGRVMTHALLPGSAARDRGSNSLAVDDIGSTLTLDERGLGFPRIFNGTVDIGAFEASNSIDLSDQFVKQQYLDFLNRQPDQSGWDFWTGQITSCGTNTQCTEVQRINVSASFFLSIEFQQTGYLVERIYKVAYGDASGTSTFPSPHQVSVPTVRFNEFLQDTQTIGQGVIVLAPGWESKLETNKQNYASAFVQTSRFMTAFPTNMTPAQFVNKLNLNAGGILSPAEQTNAIGLFGSAGDTANASARAQALRQVAENPTLFNAEKNRAFVLAQYFGYLRRNPDDAPEVGRDYTGYDFWLTKLNQFNGNYIAAEMVKAFISSSEYRQRFGA